MEYLGDSGIKNISEHIGLKILRMEKNELIVNYKNQGKTIKQITRLLRPI